MLTQSKLILLSLLAALTGSAAPAAFYVDVRMSHLILQGTPDIGDIGVELDSELPGLSPGIALGYQFSKRVSLELRHVNLGEITIVKESPYPTAFPPKPGDPVIQGFVTSQYGYEQRTSLTALALPILLWEQDKLSLRVTPLIQFEDTKVELSFGGHFPPLPNVNTVPIGTVFHRHSTSEVHPGAELTLGCRLSERARLYLHYTYSPLSHADAHLVGGGLNLSF